MGREFNGNIPEMVIANLSIRASALEKTVEDMRDAIYTALPFVEEARQDKTYKPGAVDKVVAKMRKAVGEEGWVKKI
jgi:plasmid stability protein